MNSVYRGEDRATGENQSIGSSNEPQGTDLRRCERILLVFRGVIVSLSQADGEIDAERMGYQ